MQTPIKKSLNRKCKICAKKFTTQFFNVWWCSSQCGYELSMRLKEKAQAKEMKAKKAKMKDAIQTTTELRKLLQIEINAIVRAIDYGQRCISSQRVSKTLQAGHYFAAGSHLEIQFHLWNIHGQSVKDNYFEGGAQRKYRENLIKIYGNEIFELIEMLPEMYRNLTWSKDELKEAIKIARQIFKDLPKNKTYSVTERIELRKTINDKLNLYLI
jgi:hypothetical protein